jgi:hypothetical protein
VADEKINAGGHLCNAKGPGVAAVIKLAGD